MLTTSLIQRLRDELLRADFTWSAVSRRLGEAGLAGLARNNSFPAWEAIGGPGPGADGDRQA
ncbi:MAG: hypothetical protein LBI99_02175, partial [Propionibacteriaceae bacterium]|nr:hypothetical protein [Propionibacteriaceae bacterium]